MPFQPGESGNPAGSSRAKRFYAALDRAILQDDGKRLRGAAEKLLTEAEKGEAWAIKELADRLDGKAAQSVTIGGDQANPFLAATLTDEQLARVIENASRLAPA